MAVKRDWSKLDPLIDNLKAQGWNDSQIAKDLGISRQTLVDHLRGRVSSGTPAGHHGTPEHQGTLEEYEEIIEEVHQSVPYAPHVGAEDIFQDTIAHQGVPESEDIPASAHPSTPQVHQHVSPIDSTTVHSGVPARQDQRISTPMVHPGTPSDEDWQLWSVMKTRWMDVEKMLADWQTRQALLGTPRGTPRNTMKKTYVVDTLHIELIDHYAREQGVEIKDVVNLAFQEFFERRDALPRASEEGSHG